MICLLRVIPVIMASSMPDFSVTKMVQQNNTIRLGDGWYRGNIGWKGDYAYYGKQLTLLVHYELVYYSRFKRHHCSDTGGNFLRLFASDMYNGRKIWYTPWNERLG
jgi:alpha-L-rhamnosidase